MSNDKGRPLPKFGEWDVNNPSSAEGFTVIFNKARNERKRTTSQGQESPGKEQLLNINGPCAIRMTTKKWLCCVQPGPAET